MSPCRLAIEVSLPLPAPTILVLNVHQASSSTPKTSSLTDEVHITLVWNVPLLQWLVDIVRLSALGRARVSASVGFVGAAKVIAGLLTAAIDIVRIPCDTDIS